MTDIAGPDLVPAKRLACRVEALFSASGKDFQTAPRDHLDLTFEGMQGDIHAGLTRRSGGREPWYPRGTEIRNERQFTIVAADELATAAGRMGISEIKPEWIGANMVLSGVKQLSLLPSGALLFFKGGATLKVDGQNHPCSLAGRAIAQNAGLEKSRGSALLFTKHAKRLRGLTAWVEKSGRIAVGEEVVVRVPEQWIWRG